MRLSARYRWSGEALRKHHLEDIARRNILLRAQHHLAIAARREHGRRLHLVHASRIAGIGRQWGGKPRCHRFYTFECACDARCRRAGLGPDRRYEEQQVCQTIEHDDHGRTDEQHVREIERIGRGAAQPLDQPNRLIGKIADETGER